jgi:Ser/Thr protein kinase RdoA (MazF antagonist)
MSLHRVDPRFVLPHEVRRAVVLGGLDEWRAGLESAGIEVLDEPRGAAADLVVASARDVGPAGEAGARSVIVEGARGRLLRGAGYQARQLLLRPTRERPTLALPLDQPDAVSYALERWSVVDRRWKAARMQAARALASRGRFPSWGSPVVTAATREAGPPALVAAAAELGVPADVEWFLTFGQGDSLSRNAFQLFRADAGRPEWILKFARVGGYSQRFADDERGLALAHSAGGAVAARVPLLLGRFEADGVHASLETAATGSRLRDFLSTPGDREAKVELIDRIGEWILELGRGTQRPPEALAPELERLRKDVVPSWGELAVPSGLVDELPPLPAVAQHNDLGAWNVVADGDEFAVVDWENARAAGLPLWDLLYFLGDAFVHLDAPAAPEQLPGRVAGLFAGEATSSPRLFAWLRRAVEATAVPADSVAAVATLCWLSHSLSARSHNLDLAAFTPDEPPRFHGLEGIAHAWMTHPALGTRWSVWRG